MRDLLSAILFLLSATAIEAKDDVDPHLKAAIYAGWDDLEKFDESLNAIDIKWERITLEGKQNDTKSGSSRYRHIGVMASITSSSDKIDEVVQNSRYAFYVGKRPEDNSWVARFVDLDPDSQGAQKLREGTFLARLVSPSSAILLASAVSKQKKWSAVKNDPKFIISKIERTEADTVKVFYRYENISGEFECVPQYSYIIRSGRSRETVPQFSYDMEFERKIVFSETSNRIEVKSLTYKVASDPISVGGKFRDETYYSYPDVSKTNELDEERFRLSYYGLPEPEGVVWEKPRNYLSYWLVGGGALVVVLATLVLRYLRKRPREIQ